MVGLCGGVDGWSRSVDPVARGAAMRAVNPAFIPRNHHVEAAINAAVDQHISDRSKNW
jgi:uncharacterized protein YdiU (UPF0061 family)